MRLRVNGQDVRMNPFVERMVGNVLGGTLRSLDDIPEDARHVVFLMDPGEGAVLEIDGTEVRMNAFVQKIFGNILQGIVSALDEVPAEPRRIEVEL